MIIRAKSNTVRQPHTTVKKHIRLGGQTIAYSIRHSSRARRIKICIDWEEGLVVTVRNAWQERFIEEFLRQKSAWVLRHLHRMNQIEGKKVLKVPKAEYERNKHRFLRNIKERVKFFNSLYKFAYKRVNVRNQTSLWGSCSRSGNLQFNYKLSYLPQKLVDYVVVHELCHLKEPNHSRRFWELVAKTVPDYHEIRKTLRSYVMKEG